MDFENLDFGSPLQEGRFSALKRRFGEELVCKTQKGVHDEICAKFMMLDCNLPSIW